MINHLIGIIIEKQPPLLILEVNGIGYEVQAPMSTFYQLPDDTQEIKLFTHFLVREDAHLLFGFITQTERSLFRALLKANGIGPRLALTILSHQTPATFIQSVLQHDTASLLAIPGIGKKTAERLVIEIRDKLTDIIAVGAESTPELNLPKTRQQLQDAIAALVALGYKQQDATRIATKIDNGQMRVEELIRYSLQEIN